MSCLFAFCSSLFFARLLSFPVARLAKAMVRLQLFRFGGSVRKQLGPLSLVAEIAKLQVAFTRMRAALSTVSKFIPRAVVQRLLSGEGREAHELFVRKRVCTVFFSDL